MRNSLVRISSSERLDKTNPTTNFTVAMGNDSYMGKITSFAVKEVCIPNTSYNINATNNVLYLDNQEGTEYIITIPPGQYSQSDLFAWLNNVSNNPYFSISQDPITKKYNCTKISLGIYQFSIITTQVNAFNGFLGLNTNVALEITVGTQLPNLPDLSGLRNFYVCSNTLGDGHAMISPTLPKFSCISVVPNEVPFGSINFYRANEQELETIAFPSQLHGKCCSYVDLQLRDLNGGIVDLNGLNWTLILKVFYH